jgi:hypothetical protein
MECKLNYASINLDMGTIGDLENKFSGIFK